MLYLIMGASGSGKSACLPGLRNRLPTIDWRDFDDLPWTTIPVSTAADRQLATDKCLQLAIENERNQVSTAIAGGIIFGEVLACPSFQGISTVRAVLLDCHDVIRIDRIRSRDSDPVCASQDMLSWAAWQRMHAVDPQWRKDVIQTSGAESMQWGHWTNWLRDDPRWKVDTIDTTHLSLPELVEVIAAWIARETPHL